MIETSYGALAMGSVVAGLFFLRFWRESRDRLFVFFDVAFWLLAVQWAGLGLIPFDEDGRHRIYLVRLVAYVLLVVGILDKNARSRVAR